MAKRSSDADLSLEDRAKKSPLVSAVFLVSGFIAAVAVIWGAATWAWQSATWRDTEVAKMQSLRTEMPLAAVTDILGQPQYTREAANAADGRQMIWKKNGYYVIAYFKADVMRSYELQVCDKAMKPTIGSGDDAVTANLTPLGGSREVTDLPAKAFYNAAPAFVEAYEGSPSAHYNGFRQIFRGVGTACESPWAKEDSTLPIFLCSNDARNDKVTCQTFLMEEMGDEDWAELRNLRRTLVVNTVGEGAVDKNGFAPADDLWVHPDVFLRLS